MKKFVAILSTIIVLGGCGFGVTENEASDSSSAAVSSVQEETVSVTIRVTVDGEEIEEGTKELDVEDGAILLDVMKENFDIEEKDTFMQSINGHEQDEAALKYWLFDLNGEMAPLGANETELHEGDVVEWHLEPLE